MDKDLLLLYFTLIQREKVGNQSRKKMYYRQINSREQSHNLLPMVETSQVMDFDSKDNKMIKKFCKKKEIKVRI